MKPQFICSYRGQSDYLVAGDRYRVRTHASDDGHYNPGVYDREIMPLVGCVIHDDSRKWNSFPSPDVVALFPGFVGAKYAPDFTVQFDGQQPQTFIDPCGYVAPMSRHCRGCERGHASVDGLCWDCMGK